MAVVISGMLRTEVYVEEGEMLIRQIRSNGEAVKIWFPIERAQEVAAAIVEALLDSQGESPVDGE